MAKAAKSKTSKESAFESAKRHGIKFSGDFHADTSVEKSLYLKKLATETGYKKPKSASGSTARYFYEHLYKKFGK